MVKVLQGVNTRITKEGKEGRNGGREAGKQGGGREGRKDRRKEGRDGKKLSQEILQKT